MALTVLGTYRYPGPSLTYGTGSAPAYAGGTPATNTGTFCIQATSPVGADHIFHVTESSGVLDGACGS